MMHHTMPRSGFTLIETMVAIAVLAIALTGPFVAVQTALNASYVARDQLVAASLAQEGMEYIRSVRDNNYLNNRSTWMTGLSGLSCYGNNPSGYCTIDPTRGDVNTAGAGSCNSTTGSAMTYCSSFSVVPMLYISSSNLYNQQSSGTASRFKRGVQIQVVSATEVRVSVTVSWTSAHQSYSVVVTDTLRDWI